MILWVLASITFAAVFSPWLFGWGKDFAARYYEADGVFGWLAGSCERAKFGRYFSRALMLGALLMLGPLLLRIRHLGKHGESEPFRIRPLGWRIGWVHGSVGFLTAAALLGVLGFALVSAGAFTTVDQAPSLSVFLKRALLPAVGASLIEEWLFRALLLGLWLRVAPPWQACAGTAAVYAFVHFLDPPRGVEMNDPRAIGAGFEMLGLILRNFLNPQFIAAEFLTLFTVGLALGWARLKTASLWLPIGMHAGWILSFKGFNLLHTPTPDHLLRPWFLGASLKDGLLPLVTLAITWLVLSRIANRLPSANPHNAQNHTNHA